MVVAGFVPDLGQVFLGESFQVPLVIPVPRTVAHQAEDTHGDEGQGGGSGRAAPDPLDGTFDGGRSACLDGLTAQVAGQVVGHVLRSEVALAGLFLQALHADGFKVARDMVLHPRGRDRVLLDDLLDGIHRRDALEGRTAGEHLVEHRAQGVDIGGRSGQFGITAGLLGRHVAWRSHDLAGVGLAFVSLEPLGQAEIGDLGNAVAAEEDVGGLEVAVHDAGPMGRVHRHDERDHPFGRLPGRQHRPHQPTDQATPFQQLECHERVAVVLTDVIDLQDIRVPERGDGFGLDLEARDLNFVGIGASDHLQGNEPVQPAMAGLVDDAHSAPAELTAKFVVRWFDGCSGGPCATGIRQGPLRRGPSLSAKIGGHV